MKLKRYILASIAILLAMSYAFAQKGVTGAEGQGKRVKMINKDARVYIAPMEGGFDTFIAAGIQQKKVPLVIVTDRAKADYEISGVSESDKAGWAKMLFMGSQNSNEQASIKVVELKTDEMVYAYSVHKTNSVRGKQSAGEACAKHIKEQIE
jgi:hypothetical protein